MNIFYCCNFSILDLSLAFLLPTRPDICRGNCTRSGEGNNFVSKQGTTVAGCVQKHLCIPAGAEKESVGMLQCGTPGSWKMFILSDPVLPFLLEHVVGRNIPKNDITSLCLPDPKRRLHSPGMLRKILSRAKSLLL